MLTEALYYVCCGDEPDDVIRSMNLRDTVGIPVETILKVYKWIWGQEGGNYPTEAGRWFSMNERLAQFKLSAEDFR